MRVSEKRERVGAALAECRIFFQHRHSFAVHSSREIRLPKHCIRNNKIRIHLERFMALLNSAVELPCEVKQHCQAMACRGGSRIEIQGALRHSQGFMRPPARAEIKRIKNVCSGISRIQRQGLIKMLSRSPPIPIVSKADVSQGDVSFCEMVIDLQCLLSYSLGPGHDVPGGNHIEKGEVDVGVGQTRVGQRIGRVFVDSLLEIFSCFLWSFLAAFVPVKAYFKERLIRLTIPRLALR